MSQFYWLLYLGWQTKALCSLWDAKVLRLCLILPVVIPAQGFMTAVHHSKASLALPTSSRTSFRFSSVVFHDITICNGFVPLSSVSRAEQLQTKQHEVTVTGISVLIWVICQIISSLAVCSALALIISSPYSALSPSVHASTGYVPFLFSRGRQLLNKADCCQFRNMCFPHTLQSVLCKLL